MKKSTRNYYAWVNFYGRISTESFNGRGANGYVYLAFDTKKARDAWVAENQYKNGNVIAGEITRKEIEEDLGKFYTHKNVCIKAYTDYVDCEEGRLGGRTIARFFQIVNK